MIAAGSGLKVDTISISAEGRKPLELYAGEQAMVKLVNIYESIFEQYTTGTIIIDDSLGLIEAYPITGLEYIFISYRSVDNLHENLTKMFRIYDIAEVEYDPKKPRMMYKLELVSPILIESNKNQLQCSYYNKTEEEIVKIICEDNLQVDVSKYFISEQAKYKRSLTAPNMTPLEFIDYMTEQAINTRSSGLANYVFFENRDGLNFVTLEKLFEQDVAYTLSTKISTDPTTTEAYGNILNMSVGSISKPIKNRSKFMYGGTMQEVDLLEKKTVTKTYNYDDDVLDSQVYIDKKGFKSFKSDDDSDRSVIKTVYNHGNFKYLKHAVPTRMMSIAQLEQTSVTCTLKGNTNLSVGMKVNFNYPSILLDSKDYHKYLSGNWIIANLRQNITAAEASTVVDLVKPTFKKEIEEITA